MSVSADNFPRSSHGSDRRKVRYGDRPPATILRYLVSAEVETWSWLSSTLVLQTRVYGHVLPIENAAELSRFLSWNLLAAYQELGEIGVEFSWKPWAVDAPFAERERIRDEVVDVMHFLGNMLVAIGVTDEELKSAYIEKQAKNTRRHDSGTYSARKGSLGEGSDSE